MRRAGHIELSPNFTRGKIMHPLLLLPAATFIIVIGYIAWSGLAVHRSQQPGETKGIGSENDPMS